MACIRERRGRWVVDFRDQNGRRHWESYRTKKEAQDGLTDRRKEVKDRLYLDRAALPTFAEVARAWLEMKRDHPASTFEYWQGQVDRHFVPAFGELRIDNVTAAAIERFRNTKRDGAAGHKKLARATVNQLLQTLRAILDYAIDHGYAKDNAGRRVKGVKRERKAGTAGAQAVDPSRVLTADQAGTLIEAAAPGLYRTFFKTALLTGCRSGEMLALQWRDVDLDARTLRVERSLSWAPGAEKGYGKRKATFGPPKTDSSYRTIDLARDLVHDLKVWRLQSPYKQAEELVFANSLGKPLHRAFLHKGLQLAREKRPDLPHVDLHGLRHTFASLLIQRGRPITQVSRLLGHKNPQITLEVYSHWFTTESSAGAVDDLASAIGGVGSKTVADAALTVPAIAN